MASAIRERNLRKLHGVLTSSKEAKREAETFKRRFGFEMADGKKFPVLQESGEGEKKVIDINDRFSFHALRESLPRKLREADTSSAFVQLLRAGIQLVVNNLYQITETTFEDWVTVVPSKKDSEPYAPMVGIGFPTEVAAGGLFSEVGAMGLDMKLKNRKYGSLYGAEWELTEDDQTGQIMKSATTMGEYMKLVVEVVVYAKLASISGGCTYANLRVRKSEMQPDYEDTWPYAASGGLFGGGSNRPATFTGMTEAAIKAGFIGLHQQKNQLKLKMEVHPDTILCGPKFEFDAAVIANSTVNASVPSSVAGAVGGVYALNPLKGKFDTIVSKYHFKNTGVIDDGTGTQWYITDKKKSANGAFILQMRENATVINEAPNSGQSFERDLLRFKARSRFNADYIEPRFFWRGNDGSV